MTVPLHWHTEPLLLLLVVGVSWAYALACGPLQTSFGERGYFAMAALAAVGLALALGLGLALRRAGDPRVAT